MKQSGFAIFSLLIGALFLCFTIPVFAFDYFQPLPNTVPVPDNNPNTVFKVELGKQLFFDPRLSLDGSLTCNNCHNIAAGGEDGRAQSLGYKQTPTRRSAPTLWNIAYQTVLFWDGRARSLEDQAKEHLTDANIFGISDENVLVERLAGIPEYRRNFARAFGEQATISLDTIAKALASFERTLITPDSPFDKYIRGNNTLLSEAALRGMEAFRQVGCLACHFGVNFAGPAPGPALHMGDGFYELFPNNRGSKYDKQYHLTDDKGIYEVTKNPADKYLWRVPPLRNIALTAPYFHNGSAKTLVEAVRIMAKTQENKVLSDQEIADIIAFLNSLTGQRPALLLPRLPATPGVTVFK
jgi:cytochrome c peroxidase